MQIPKWLEEAVTVIDYHKVIYQLIAEQTGTPFNFWKFNNKKWELKKGRLHNGEGWFIQISNGVIKMYDIEEKCIATATVIRSYRIEQGYEGLFKSIIENLFEMAK